MNYRYKVSFIVPIYNVESYLARCIDSLLNQDVEINEYEIILVNDGSTDNSGKIAEEYAKQHDNIHLYHQKNGGLSVARNTGMDHVQGKYTIFVDSDDAWKENKLKDLLKVTEDNNLDICFFLAIINCPKGIEIGCKQKFEYNKIFDGEFLLLENIKVASIWDKIYRTDFIKDYRYYPGISHQDVEFNYRTYPFAKRVMFTDHIIYDYTWNDNSISRSQCLDKKLKRAKDDIVIASNMNKFVSQQNLSERLNRFYKKKAGSMIFSHLYNALKNNSNVTYSYMNEFLNFAKDNGVYPIRTKTDSILSTILLIILDCESFYRLMLKIRLKS